MEIKEEIPSTSFSLEDENEVVNTNFVTKIKCESFGYNIQAETEPKEEAVLPDFYSPNVTENPLMLVKKYDKNYDMHTKIEAKEEVCLLEKISTEATSIYDEIRDGMDQDFSSESSRSYIGVSSDCAEELENNLSFSVRVNTRSQEASSTEKSVYLEPDHENIDSTISQDSLTQPNNTHIDNSVTVKRNRIRHRCDICDKSFKFKSRLKQHNFMHEAKTTKCPICEKFFTQPSYLKRHIMLHAGVKPFKCKICNKDFARIQHLRQHNLIHETEKPYKCEICDKSFTVLSNLKRHNMSHENGKKHKCDICGKFFAQAAYLKLHSLLHGDKQPYKCEICDKRFMHFSHLRAHNLIHEGKRAFKCGICEKSFLQATHLKSHSFIHMGIKPFKCDICEKHFSRSSNLKKHNLIHEGKNE